MCIVERLLHTLWFGGILKVLDVIPGLPVRRQKPLPVCITQVHQVELAYSM
jgi:hypothetical protein